MLCSMQVCRAALNNCVSCAKDDSQCPASMMFTLSYSHTAGDPPYLVYVLYQQAIRVADIDGSNLRTLLDGIRPVHLQYDLR